jgi:hypothetical protein
MGGVPMLKHYVLFTFEKGFLTNDVVTEFGQVFQQIKENIPGVRAVHIYKNYIERPSNMDLMVILDLDDSTVLPKYLSYPAHETMGKKYDSHITNRVSFDYPY